MMFNLNIEENCVKDSNGKRAMTFEEIIELICQNCQDADIEVELEIDNELITVCRKCALSIISNKLNNPDFIEKVELIII